MSGLRLKSHDILRDPTIEELHNGPTRNMLPESIQKMDNVDTACTFCGVSYLVFSEIQILQSNLKNYHEKTRVVKRQVKEEKQLVHNLMAALVDMRKNVFSSFKEVEERFKNIKERSMEDAMKIMAMEKDILNYLQDKQEYMKIQEQMEQRIIQENEKKTRTIENELRAYFSKEILDLNFENNNLKTSILKLQEKNSLLENDMRKHLQEKVDMEHDISKKKEYFDRMVNNYQKEIENLKPNIAELEQKRSDVRRLEAELNLVQSNHTSMLKECEEIRRQKDCLEKNKKLLLNQEKDMKVQNEAHERKICDLKSRNDSLSQKIEQISVSCGQKVQEKVNTLENVKLETHKEIERLKSIQKEEINRIIETYESKLRKNNEISKADKDQLTLSEEKLRKLEQELDIGLKTINALESKAQELESREMLNISEIQKLENNNKRHSAEIRNLLDENNRVSKLLEQNEKLIKEKLRDENLLKRMINEKEENEKKLNGKIDSIKQQMRKELDELKETYEKEIRQMNKIINDKDKSNKKDEIISDAEKLNSALEAKNQEIQLLRQTVHRECLERTSLLEKLRSSKVLPDIEPETSVKDRIESHIQAEDNTSYEGNNQEIKNDSGKASIYERLKRTGKKKLNRTKG